jgi:hypothetical protein
VSAAGAGSDSGFMTAAACNGREENSHHTTQLAKHLTVCMCLCVCSIMYQVKGGQRATAGLRSSYCHSQHVWNRT